MITGAAGMVIQGVSGVPMPIVPPGLVLLVGSALLIAFTGWRWTPALGALVGLAEAAAIGIGQLDTLADPSALGIFLGTWIRTLGIVMAITAGVPATVIAYRRARGRRPADELGNGASRHTAGGGRRSTTFRGR
ncbi:hypothetical protein [Nonomuraea diastatica]|uniref:Uncharacterized protein n=1 Tax=Nonomuraea diastatica TaxID=1848329 RepID=A0A4R4VRR5_9ACTN|nr:hypothetical protein [Nonomuraea diastatica]TDD02880.1 hypothetical protein E1294_51020 [Nonomuraea diastatica]